MANIFLKCSQCNGRLEFDSGQIQEQQSGVCTHCGIDFSVKDELINQAVRYQSIAVEEEGEADKPELEQMQAFAETLVLFGELQRAKSVLDKSTELYPEDWRAWFGLVKYHTADFSNLSDTQHVYFLGQARKFASGAAAEEIDSYYFPFSKRIADRKRIAEEKAEAQKKRLAEAAVEEAKHRKKVRLVKAASFSGGGVVLTAVALVVIFVLVPLIGAGSTGGPTFKAQTVSAGAERSYVIDGDGALWEVQKKSFKKIKTKSGAKFTTVSSGSGHNLAIDADGALWAWTSAANGNQNGQIGDGTNDARSSPVRIQADTTFKAVSAGYRHSLAIDANGGLWAWGRNWSGQLGDGSTTDRKEPAHIKPETKFQYISAGENCSFAIDENGRLWGFGSPKAVANGTAGSSNITTPDRIQSDAQFKAVSAGSSIGLAIDTTGKLWAWGDNDRGQLGDGTTTTPVAPVQIMSSRTFIAVSVAHGFSGGHNLAIDNSNGLWAWGSNDSGQLGSGTTNGASTPGAVLAETKFVAATAGEQHSILVDDAGSVWACGNGYTSTPVKIK